MTQPAAQAAQATRPAGERPRSGAAIRTEDLRKTYTTSRGDVPVLAVLYLLFNEGYSATAGTDLLRPDLCAEAIRLARLLAGLMPGEPEVAGLLALMLLHDARRPPGWTRPGNW